MEEREGEKERQNKKKLKKNFVPADKENKITKEKNFVRSNKTKQNTTKQINKM